MHTIFVDKNIPKIILVKVLRPIWPNVIFSSLSPVHFANVKNDKLPGTRWVRVRNKQCGICATDLSLFFADADLSIAPAALPSTNRFYLGHEIVGYVTEIGAEVNRLNVGDRVIMDTRFQGATCLSQEIEPACYHCAEGNYMLCENAAACIGFKGIGGGWGDSFIAHETELYRVPDVLTDDQVMMIEPMSSGLRAVLRCPPTAKQQILILGSGIVGLNVLQCLRAISPMSHITVMVRHRHQAEMAQQLGANEIIFDKDGYEKIAEITKAKMYRGSFNNTTLVGGFDIIYDCVGSARTLQNSLRWTCAGGTVVMVGIKMRSLRIDLNPIWQQEVNLSGICAHGTESWEGKHLHAYDIVVRLFHEGKLTTNDLITHRFPLSQWKKAIKTAVDKRTGSIKVVFNCME